MPKLLIATLSLLTAMFILCSCSQTISSAKGQATKPATSAPVEGKGSSLPLPSGTPKRPVGMDAIAVKGGKTPPFAKDDVITYFKTHNIPKSLGAVGQVSVDSLE